MLLGIKQAAFDGTHRDMKPFCDLRLGKLLPEVQIQDLALLIAELLQRLLHHAPNRNAADAVHEAVLFERIDRDLELDAPAAEIVRAFSARDAEHPGAEGFRAFQFVVIPVGRNPGLLQNVVCVRPRLQTKAHVTLD